MQGKPARKTRALRFSSSPPRVLRTPTELGLGRNPVAESTRRDLTAPDRPAIIPHVTQGAADVHPRYKSLIGLPTGPDCTASASRAAIDRYNGFLIATTLLNSC